jgi:hypothetical protein
LSLQSVSNRYSILYVHFQCVYNVHVKRTSKTILIRFCHPLCESVTIRIEVYILSSINPSIKTLYVEQFLLHPYTKQAWQSYFLKCIPTQANKSQLIKSTNQEQPPSTSSKISNPHLSTQLLGYELFIPSINTCTYIHHRLNYNMSFKLLIYVKGSTLQLYYSTGVQIHPVQPNQIPGADTHKSRSSVWYYFPLQQQPNLDNHQAPQPSQQCRHSEEISSGTSASQLSRTNIANSKYFPPTRIISSTAAPPLSLSRRQHPTPHGKRFSPPKSPPVNELFSSPPLPWLKYIEPWLYLIANRYYRSNQCGRSGDLVIVHCPNVEQHAVTLTSLARNAPYYKPRSTTPARFPASTTFIHQHAPVYAFKCYPFPSTIILNNTKNDNDLLLNQQKYTTIIRSLSDQRIGGGYVDLTTEAIPATSSFQNNLQNGDP